MKSSFNLRKPELAQLLAAGAVVAMIGGLFFSRAILSGGIFIFFLLAPFRLGWRHWLHQASRDPLVWIFSLAWLLPVLSGFWSDDTSSWMDVVRIKLPLMLLPLGWVGLSISDRWRQRIGWMLVSFVFVGMLYSWIPWWMQAGAIQQDYLRGKTLLTPLDNDRVRFSWLIVAVLFWLQLQWAVATARLRWLIGVISIFFVLYLHALAVRIGLLCFYMLALFWILRWISSPSLRKWAIPALLLFLFIPLFMYWTVPTFRARIDYIRYDWSYTFQGKYLPGGNDAIRVQSLQVAGALIRSHPIYGVGFGDIRSAMDSAYHRINPNLSESERIYPANEWAVYGVGLGWMGLIAFSIALFALFFIRTEDPFRWRSWVLATILTLVTDIGLEVQYGVFLVPFLLLFLRESPRTVKNQEIRG
jgi:hypothetical protein